MSSSTDIDGFRAAMQKVYGSFESLNEDELWNWQPPESSGGHRGRYLWTDAFGVLNFLTLHQETSDEKYLHLAIKLIKTVHEVLGRTRDGKTRLPGASDYNPLNGGLRIGKMDEGGPDADGQYHHYLTLWMFALNRMSLAVKDSNYNDQAVALAKAIHPRFFVNTHSATPRMVWKISMDMSKPLVDASGKLDAVTGFVTFSLLAEAAKDSECLDKELVDYQRVIDQSSQHSLSGDTLDLGMELWVAHWGSPGNESAERLGLRCLETFDTLVEYGLLEGSFKRRLAFRDFGACLGLRCYAVRDPNYETAVHSFLDKWTKYMGDQPEDLQPISQIMYAAALIPGAFKKGYLGTEPTQAGQPDEPSLRAACFPRLTSNIKAISTDTAKLLQSSG
ncbi:MAG: hypothetical protein Q9225_001171 [Loekoesia sp. 1 TL-2023]